MEKVCAILVCSLQLFLASCNAQVPGCTDPLANNYEPAASLNDGSCTYDPISVSPISTSQLSETLSETSGLLLWDGYIWTHNDNSDTKLYALDTVSADIKKYYSLEGVINNDWEEISQDEQYLYIGDFGNNSGSRMDLHFLRIEKKSVKSDAPIIDTIWFSYEDQVDFNQKEAFQTDFDCEAFIVSVDSIYLFTKQWISVHTSVYSLPKIPGTYTARKIDDYDIQGLITGATFLDPLNLLVLCGYTSLLHPFLYLLYDFERHNFFSGNKRRINVTLPFHQVEGVTTKDGLKYYVSNESFKFQPVANSSQKLHIFDLRKLLVEYLIRSTEIGEDEQFSVIEVYPNPSSNFITIRKPNDQSASAYELIDQISKVVLEGVLYEEYSTIYIGQLLPGYYTLRIEGHYESGVPVLKL